MNDVWLLNSKEMQWERLETVGRAPSRRMGHTCTEVVTGTVFLLGGMYSVKSGGRNSRLHSSFEVFELATKMRPMRWTRIQSHGINPGMRAYHTAVISPWDNSSIYVFGGNLVGT